MSNVRVRVGQGMDWEDAAAAYRLQEQGRVASVRRVIANVRPGRLFRRRCRFELRRGGEERGAEKGREK